jgi:hypothetical protein
VLLFIEMENSELIYYMERAKSILEQVEKGQQPAEYSKICQSIKEFIAKYCPHEIEEDDIDISPDKSQRIKYCKICFTTLG